MQGDKFIINIMDEDDAFFEMEPEEEEVRQIVSIPQFTPAYEPRKTQKADKIPLKMIEIPKEEHISHYVPFKIDVKKQQMPEVDESNNFNFNSPFADFYDKQQLVYQKLQNDSFNRYKEMTYFAGSFIPKNIFPNYLKEDSTCLDSLAKEYYDAFDILIEKDKETLQFDSKFESGNLFAAFKIGKFQYDLVMQNDTNSRGNNQWFYFSVQKMRPGQGYTFHVVNYTKNDSLFNYGMLPAVYSTVGKAKKGEDWKRKGSDVAYEKCELQREGSSRHYYKLSFTISTQYQNDKLYIAHSFPYSFSKLEAYMQTIINKNKDVVTKVSIGKTISKKNMPALIITQQILKKKDNRKAVVIMARQHPGETQGSYVCEGLVNKILEKTKEGEYLRKNYVFYVIPMVNIDGVIFGHYRTNLMGKDLNRKWDSSEKQTTCPEVVNVKNFISEVYKTRQIRFIIDLHGHSKKLNSFFYGNPCPQNPQLVRFFPYMCSRMNAAVEFMDCTFASEEYKRRAARIYLSFLYRQIQVYTFETSFYAFINNGKKQEFTPQLFGALGQTLGQALYLLFENQIKITQASEFNLSKNNSNIKQTKSSMVMKYWKELKENKILLGVGDKQDSGSESKPEEGEIKVSDLKSKQVQKTIEPEEKLLSKNSIRFSTRKSSRDKKEKERRQFIKPIRNKVLALSQVNAVLPDKYHMGLQPIKKREAKYFDILEIGCQTQPTQYLEYRNFSTAQIKAKVNLISQSGLSHSRRHSELMSSINKNNNMMFRIEMYSQIRIEKTIEKKQTSCHVSTQTMISFQSKELFSQKSVKLVKNTDSKYDEYLRKVNESKMYDFDAKLRNKNHLTVDPSSLERELTLSTPPLNIHKKEIVRK